ncbi:hypothetical protein A3A59_06295 [Candidatus Gottesmanbacteria bacterium RIFCSPLOWO2_01_FULL_42_10]|uniref:Short chain dehydrogenase n=1 Tax=Candidatus Gottesmanbacteria bacterium GW2011_GWB1_44_11c TaxID=1618447 RepID=A0A0G1GIR8_9BACT|nr:MAG: hypothetical protein UW22_C0075G0003 [Candidatus Gottesmanbacteria bacterium GW2011_GWB1_44_11c]OGG28027.1 MAG: hypothetical protein A3A59_06295 [Candidatus Gottesmanbacteria bacterium RIFCSPLOWO2_01_FULL_42_10]
MERTILITGTNSGIGLETAKTFLLGGYFVFAGVRDLDRGNNLLSFAREKSKLNQLNLVGLDVNSEASVNEAVSQIKSKTKALDVVVNNAGFGVIGALEDVSTEELKSQFETNFFGVHRVTRAILPLFKTQKQGILVNISSMAGKITFPFWGAYTASKFALESYTESLRMELGQWGIRVYLVEPGLIESNFHGTGLKLPKEWKNSTSGYKSLYEKYARSPTAMAFGGRSNPQVVANKIWQLVKTKPGKFRHPVGKFAKLATFARWLLPDEVFLPLISKFR